MGRIAVVDYGMGNLRSVSKAIEHVAPLAEVIVTDDPRVVRSAERVVFPGQGAMRDCMREMDARELREEVLAAARSKPFLGICIGLQMLFTRSEEGDTRGLDVLPGKVIRFPKTVLEEAEPRLKVPHMGWNEVDQGKEHPLWRGVPGGTRFYFVHSYFVQPEGLDVIAGTTHYGVPFTSAIARDNIFAVQFHPEKSQAAGLRLLGNFVSWNP